MSDAALFLPLPDDDTLYAALLARDPAYDGFAFVGVKSTGVFCRLTCPARKPKRENTLFFDSIKGCVEAGFRPCLRCRPLERLGTRGRWSATCSSASVGNRSGAGSKTTWRRWAMTRPLCAVPSSASSA